MTATKSETRRSTVVAKPKARRSTVKNVSTVVDSPNSLEALDEWYDANLTVDEPGDWLEVEATPDPSVVRSVRLRRSTVVQLNAAAAAAGIGPTELMRRWIEERLEVGESPLEAKVRLALLRSMADALVREIGIPGITVSIVIAEPAKPRREPQPRKRS